MGANVAAAVGGMGIDLSKTHRGSAAVKALTEAQMLAPDHNSTPRVDRQLVADTRRVAEGVQV